jgi:hypothetical protein
VNTLEIAGECNTLYACIHPNEKLAISKLSLDKKKRASLNQFSTFEGHDDVPPQAYFSESHLDTLGFCFWLALIKRENPNKDAIIVFDDIFTSVDAQHMNRIVQLITDESKNFAQVFITTHQRLWQDMYRYQQASAKLIQMIELQGWSLSKGISNFETRLAVDEIIAFIAAAPFDRQITASKAGILLEAILDHLSLQYRCRVARSANGNYTLGELLDGTSKLLDKLKILHVNDESIKEKDTTDYILFVDIKNEIRSLNFLRNQVGAHFNLSGTYISDADIKKFANLTVNLGKMISCSVCGQIPNKKMETHYQCSCLFPACAQLLPLQL